MSIKSISSLCVASLARALNEKARLEKIYLYEEELYSLKLHYFGSGSVEIAIKPGSFLCLTEYKIPRPKHPPEKISVLRRTLNGTIIEKVYQHRFDRILVFEGSCKGDPVRIVVELFGDGNLVFEKGGKIVYAHRKGAWRHREISLGIKYEFPPGGPDPREISVEGLKEILMKYKDVVRGLAKGLGLGGEIAEEACLRAKVKKDKNTVEIGEDEIKRLLEKVREIISEAEGSEEGFAYYDSGKCFSISPIPLSIYSSKEVKVFPSLSKAIEEIMLKPLLEKEEEVEKEKKRIEEKYRRILEEQDKALRRLRERAKILRKVAEAIYSNLEEYMKVFEEAKRLEEEGDVGRIPGYDPKKRSFKVIVKEVGREIQFSLNKSFFQNLSSLYEEAKKMEKKARELEEKMKEIKRRMEREIKIEKKSVERRKGRRRKWFERFKWFISSSGFLVIGGKDAKSNEEVVRKYLGDKDLYAHADIRGAPSVVIISGGEEIDDVTKREACEFAAIHSKAWGRLHQVDAYWVFPTQVTKTPNPGEYLPKGAFVIRGKRNYFNRIEMKGGIGILEIDGEKKVMFGPVSAIKARCKEYLILSPGDVPKEELAKAIAEAYEEDPSYIASILPPGGFSIIEVKGERSKKVLDLLGDRVEGRIRRQKRKRDEDSSRELRRLVAFI